jgi:hypothetical protein
LEVRRGTTEEQVEGKKRNHRGFGVRMELMRN